VAVAFFEVSRLREQGHEPRGSAVFRFIHTHSFAPVLALSVLMMLLYLAWLYMAETLYFGTFGASAPRLAAEFVHQLFSTRAGIALIVYGNLVGLVFAWGALAVSVVSFPLALDRPVTASTAIAVSVRAVTANAFVFAVWGLVVVSLLLVGAALLLIGLAVTLPILGHATWHLYRKVVDTSGRGAHPRGAAVADGNRRTG
jgi:uncharacterized membrane protein